jgi:cell division protease FtsH
VDFQLARDKVLMGAERRSMVIKEEEKWTTAVHEAGHTVVAMLSLNHDPVHKVTIIPRGAALGVTQFLPAGDQLSLNKREFEARIQSALGGRIAEEIFFNTLTTGASSDLRTVTRMARSMVCDYGMSERLGPVTYGSEEGSVFMGKDYMSKQQDYSEQTAREIDQEVRQIVENQYATVKQLLTERKDAVELIAKALMDRETLDIEELKALMEGKELPIRERVIIPTYAEKERQAKEKRKAAGIFTTPPKPATS